MKKEFDFDHIGKKMPYTTPDGFFDQLEDDIWKEVKDDFQKKEEAHADASGETETSPKKSRLRLVMQSALAVAASVALMIVIGMNYYKTGQVSINDVDQAFSQLTAADQAYLLNVYQEDVFINE